MVKQGYKQTEIGVIPEVWDYGVFSNFVKLRHGFQFLEHHFSSSGVPVIKIGTLKDSGGIDVNKFTFVSEDIFEKFKSIQLFKGDVVMALTGATLGKVSKVDYNERCLQNYRVGLFNGKEGVDNNFIYHILQSFLVQKTVKELVNSGAQPNLGKADFDKIIIPLPPLAEQEAIAKALSDADAWIESLEQLIAKKRLIKQGAMQTLLTPQEDWEVKKLGDYVKFQTGFPFSSEFFNTKMIGERLIKNRDLRSDDSIFYYSGEFKKDFIVNNEDLLIGMDGDFEPVLWKKGKALLNQRVGRVLKLKEISIQYLAYSLIDKLKEIEESTGSTTVKHLSHSDIENLEYKIPSLSEQERIATILSDMDAEIEALEQKLAKAKQIKQGLMQKLLTGRIRLV
ncbi:MULTISPECIES: restriction endonuclease subunit S [unclassified Empedobacter]|uniref:restriction endonuclease subunit S n=1 Tax=unclassified Empedobacter TaxID=2643773 RepID=UPI0025C2F79C|nr:MULTISPECIES: restriction endonuclease subunit S [unclassified Empedobacter]